MNGDKADETMTSTTMRMRDAFAHRAYPYAEGERCRVCKHPATHKVGEYTTQDRHEFTAYLCCEHFGAIMGRVATHWCAGEWPAQP
jgi:hypothetical protein